MSGDIRSLPRDIMVQIFTFLRPGDIFSAFLVCKFWVKELIFGQLIFQSKLKDDKVLVEAIKLKVLAEGFVWDPTQSNSLMMFTEDKRGVSCLTSV